MSPERVSFGEKAEGHSMTSTVDTRDSERRNEFNMALAGDGSRVSQTVWR